MACVAVSGVPCSKYQTRSLKRALSSACSFDTSEDALQREFHEMFRLPLERRKHGKKSKKKTPKERRKLKNKATDIQPWRSPVLEIQGNPSPFAVFTNVRQCILVKHLQDSARNFYWITAPQSAMLLHALDSDSENEGDGTADSTDALQIVPRIVGVGLCTVFELIRESRSVQPAFCLSVLRALLDVLQGQQPEGFRSEPPELLDKMFDLLLDIATAPAVPVQHGQAHSSNSEVLPQLTSNACACLLSLVVATGDTSKILSAAAALLMSPQSSTAEEFPMPSILVAMQKSVQAVLLGKVQRPSWFSHGIPKTAHCGTFSLHLPKSSHFAKHMLKSHCTIACDGKFLYLFRQGILYKLGTGFGGTVKGEFIASQQLDGTGWIGVVQDYLYIHHSLGRINEFLKVDKHTLRVEGVVTLEEDLGQSVYFSDGEFLGLITATRDNGVVVRTVRPSALHMTCTVELNLKLSRKCVEIFGSGVFNEETEDCLLDLGCEEEPMIITSGKEFALVKTASGKVLYTGKAQSIGIKQTTAAGKWAELPITKCPKIADCSVGHDGTHALLVSENGAVFFVGIPRRGEDGEVGKGRRQPKSVKPKKMLKMEGRFVVSSACNNGTSALITRSGELFLFGKDASHADHVTGLVTGLKDVAISQVALGKAHVVALSTDGHVYTFGMSNRGQCGREFAYPLSKDVHHMALVVPEPASLLQESGLRADEPSHHARHIVAEEEEDDDDESEEQDMICPPGGHRWADGREMRSRVCTVCGECTVCGASGSSSGDPDRQPGKACDCVSGDCGCLDCGCCRVCATEDDYDAELVAWNRAAAPAADGRVAVGGAGVRGVGGPLLDNKQAKVIIFDVRYGGRVGARLEDKLRRSIEEYRFHHRRKQGGHLLKPAKGSPGANALNPYRSLGGSRNDGADVQDAGGHQAEDAASSDLEREPSKVTPLSPAELVLPVDIPAVQVACGLHHTVVLLHNGQVLTFGSNQHGQLGHGDLVLRGSPTLVYSLPTITQVAAGNTHSVFLTAGGQVYTCGSYQNGQLGRDMCDESWRRPSSGGEGHSLWHAVPRAIPGIGVKRGRRATWIGASGDHTFVKLEEVLTSASSLAHCSLIANRTCLGIISRDTEQASKFKCLMINRSDGSSKGFNSANQVDLKNHAVCLDSVYNVVWSLNQKTLELSWYSIVWSEAVPLQTSPDGLSEQAVQLPLFLGPELSLPGLAGYPVGRCQAALNLLGALDVLTAAQERDIVVREDIEQARQQSLARAYTREDFSTVNRFESHGGGWGYSGHSVEAIRVMADTDILLGGVGLFGGRGEYTALIRIFDVGTDGGDQETDGEMLTETEEIPYECGARQKYPILFEEPILLQANRWYVVWAHVSGPSSDCGSSGQSVVTTEDQVVFYFKSSKKSNNGTDVNAGQIPQLLYRVITPDVQASGQPADQSESVTILSHKFSKTVTLECFQSLLKLLNWGWKAFRAGLCELADGPSSSLGRALLLDLQRLLYICAASLHLLRIYINEVYPIGPLTKKVQPESSRMAECVADTQSLLSCILSGGISLPGDAEGLLGKGAAMQMTLLEECEAAFMACYHAFYPSTTLKWRGLCELLVEPARSTGQDCGDRLLAAVLSSLCSPAAQLTCLLPPSLDRETRPCVEGPSSPESPSTGALLPDAADSSTVYPLLVEVIARKTLKEGCPADNCSFKDVLERLLSIVIAPVQSALKHDAGKPSVKLVSSTCAFLSAVVAELSSQTIGCAVDVQRASRQALHCTPSRFSRVCANRTWNTGNGSPDAICFSVDRPGVLIAGACIYGGIGNEWRYEFDILDDTGAVGELPQIHRWKPIAEVHGSFGQEDCFSDVAEVKFDRPIAIKENTKYALRLKNHGARTNNGDGGVTQVKGPDGTTFTFSDSSLSFNGTNHTRGQIPQILYYSTPHDTESQQAMRDLMELQARRNVLNICSTIVKASSQLLSEAASEQDDEIIYQIGSSHLMTQLLPLILAHLCPVASSDSQSAVEVLDLVQKLLKWVSTLNQKNAPSKQADALIPMDGGTGPAHYAVVESDHPYKPATVFVSKVKFTRSVRWMALEFDPRCSTTQKEDSLQLYIPSHNGQGHVLSTGRADDGDEDANTPFWPVLQRFCRTEWPAAATVLPGNELVFSLETASDCAKDNKASSSYGFRCQVTGYEGVFPGSAGGLLHLEKELSYLGGMCAASLLRRDLILPTVLPSDVEEDMEVAEPLARQVFSSHSSLLSRGFALAHLPTIQQALEGSLSFSDRSNERPFLHDFVSCTPGTSGGRLARWLQPECCVDPKQCELICSQEELKCGWPSLITVFTRDQYGYLVHVPDMKVEVRAVPMNAYNQEHVPCSATAGSNDQTGLLTFGGHPPPSLDVPYEVTVKDKMLYYAITMMRQYQDYSFEELRFVSPTKKRLIENMLVCANDDGSYTANWTPGSVGWYLLHAIIDGFEIGSSQCRLVEVKEPPQGLVIPSRSVSQKSSHQPNKMRKFQAKYSAGLRIRSHPSLQSKQIGVVQVDGIVAFVDELHNDDGVWVRLSPETIKNYCKNGYSEAWCLQYNQHIGKTLLVPFEEPKAVREEYFSDRSNVSPKKKELKEPRQQSTQVQQQQQEQHKQHQQQHRQQQQKHEQKEQQQHQSIQHQQPPHDGVRHGTGPGMYQVANCGAAGHNVRSKPNLKAPPIGMLAMDSTIIACEEVSNSEGVWLRLNKDSLLRHNLGKEGEAWTLARTAPHVVPEVCYLRHESEVMQSGDSDDDSAAACGYRCSQAAAMSSLTVRSRGYNFGMPASADRAGTGCANAVQGLFTFGSGTSDPEGGSSGSASPFVFGSPASTPSTSTNALADSEHTGPASERSEAPTSSGSFAGGSSHMASRRRTSTDSSPPLARAVPPELRGVSVRDLVRAIGESRANGNGATPPGTPPATPPVRRRRSSANSKPAASSPVPIPGVTVPCSYSDTVLGLSEDVLSHSGSQAQIESARSATPSQGSLTESGSFPKHSVLSPRRASIQSESSVSSHLGSFLRELRDTSATGCIGCITQRTTDSPLSTPGTPKKENLSPTSSLKSFTQAGTQTSPEGGPSSSIKGHFSIGSNSSRDESPRISPKMSRRERNSSSGTRHVLRGKRERVHSEPTERTAATEPLRQGLAPSVAECLRAVFCAFLWHEGVVHDAMACASYLKFNPDLRKSITKKTVTAAPTAAPLTKEQKARFRHSVEVTSPSLLQLQQLETLQSNEPLNENIKLKRAFSPATASDQVTREGSSVQEDVATDLPRALRFLVLLWDQVTGVCKQAIKDQVVLPSLFSVRKNIKHVEQALVRGSERQKSKKKRNSSSAVVNGRATSAVGAASSEKELTCELCGLSFVPASQYQSRPAHSGCGDSIGIRSFGAGSASHPCGGWTGSYGESRTSSSGWHHLCDRCREKLCQVGGGQRSSLGGRHRSSSISAAAARVASPAQDTVHHNMKNNAMFLLELSSSGMKSRRSGLPSLAEAEMLLPSNQFAVAGPIQYFNMLGLSLDALSFGDDFVPSEPGTSSSQTAELDAESVAALNGNEAVEDTFASGDEAGLGPTVTVRGGGRVFHRSVSVGLTHLDWAEKDLAEVAVQEVRALVIPRKRNNSSGSEGMSSILCQPSAALTKLVEPDACATDLTVQRPVMQFVLQRHDLENMRFAIQQSLRKATCRIYAMQAFNWLLRNVTQSTCLHDLLWCLVAAMSPPVPEKPEDHSQGKEDAGHKKEVMELDKEAPCEHPLSDMSLAGEACLGPLRSAFHTLLQTISDLMVFLPVGASLQQMAMQCFRLRFMPSDHAFLHRSHVFSNISRILSHTEEEAAAPSELCAVAGTSASAASDVEHGSCQQSESPTEIEVLRDLTQVVKLTASSRPGMVNSLYDNSTETFWESGDEDRNKTKVFTLACNPDVRPTIVCVYVDNARDSSYKVNSITFKFGPNLEEVQKLKQMDVEGHFQGWLSCVLPESIHIGPNGSVWRLELRGPENTLRLRQIKVLGHGPGSGTHNYGDCRSLCIQQRNCEAETLRVFRLLTSQVFGKLLGGDAESPEEDVPARPVGDEATSPERPETSNDLKEHMVGILFSRSKLTHLQKQVCSHIVAALRKEARRVREEWEALLCSPQPSPPQRTAAAMAGGSGANSHMPAIGGSGGDTYCFEMLSMVLALSGSAVGRAHLSQQAGLLRDIFSLLHTGSARVQRQVTSLLRRVLPEVPPLTLAAVLGVVNLPPSEYGLPPSSNTSPDANTVEDTAPLDIHRVGLLDVLLACVAKALTLQARSKGGRSQATTLATAIHPRDHLGARWWLRGTTSRKLAQGIVQLLRDMAAGKLTEAWARVTKGAIAENILNLTKLAEKYRTPAECLKTPTLWLALASLCVLDQDHVEKLSSGQWAKSRGDGLQVPPRPTCDNHDDGETPAIILCNVCGNVCADCDRFLHLHRRTKTHQRQVFKEEEEAIKVDLHEGCGRTKLFWVMALADSKTLKAMVEFRENSRGKSTSVPTAGICRFCGAPGATGLLSSAVTCTDCREHAANACSKTHPCGHLCNGIRNETTCLPCLHGCGAAKGLRQDADDMCMICFSEALSCAPAVQLSCGHVFHYHCCKTVLSRGWSGPRITFGFSLCPICKAPMEHAVLKDLLEPIRALFEDVKRKALMRLEYEGLHRAEAITTPGARFYDNPAGFAMERYAYYVCFKCKKAYYGGEVRCDIEAGPVDEYNPAELVCGGCSDISRAQMCPKHGTDFLEYKCRYCCSVAVFFCFGTTHFCNACHDDFQRVANLPKQQLPRCPAGPKAKQLEGEECPLHIKHPPTGEEFALGCGVCRNTHTF